jgi:hypothetical protein
VDPQSILPLENYSLDLNYIYIIMQVVCEEMAWLSFYPGASPITGHGEDHDKVKTGVSKVDKQRSIALAVQVCSLWVDSYMQNSAWVQQPEGFRASSFLQRR